ncbi:MAG: SCO family protein [Gemmataceae bacterium]
MKHALFGALFLVLLAPALARADENSVAGLESVGIVQRLDEQVPLDLDFYDEASEVVSLGKCFNGKPVILVLAYYRCPMLCNEVLNTLRDCMGSRQFELALGEDFEVVTVSFDPAEKPDRAAAKKANYAESVMSLGQSKAEQGWHFLTGSRLSIKALTDAVGFHYAYDQEKDQFAHASGIMVLTPQGKISRYFLGLDYPPRFVRLALVEASEDRIGTPVDQVLLRCYEYDAATGKYTLAVMKVVRAGGILTLLALGAFLLVMWRRERGRRMGSAVSSAACQGSGREQ